MENASKASTLCYDFNVILGWLYNRTVNLLKAWCIGISYFEDLQKWRSVRRLQWATWSRWVRGDQQTSAIKTS